MGVEAVVDLADAAEHRPGVAPQRQAGGEVAECGGQALPEQHVADAPDDRLLDEQAYQHEQRRVGRRAQRGRGRCGEGQVGGSRDPVGRQPAAHRGRDHRQGQRRGGRRGRGPHHDRSAGHGAQPQVDESAVLAGLAQHRRAEHQRHDGHDDDQPEAVGVAGAVPQQPGRTPLAFDGVETDQPAHQHHQRAQRAQRHHLPGS